MKILTVKLNLSSRPASFYADNTVALSSMMNIRGLDVANRFNLNSIEVVL